MTVSLRGITQAAPQWIILGTYTFPLAFPTGTAAGDLALVFGTWANGFTIPSGWVSANWLVAGSNIAYWRVLDGTEGSTHTATIVRSLGVIYSGAAPVLLVVKGRTFNHAPNVVWQNSTSFVDGASSRTWHFNAYSPSDATDTLYVGWLAHTSGLATSEYGTTFVGATTTWDAGLTPLASAGLYDGSGIVADDDPRAQSFTGYYTVAGGPVTAGVIPASDSLISWAGALAGPSNRYIVRTREVGVAEALAPYWGILVGT